jgi:hypothetical protein
VQTIVAPRRGFRHAAGPTQSLLRMYQRVCFPRRRFCVGPGIAHSPTQLNPYQSYHRFALAQNGSIQGFMCVGPGI